MIGHASKHYKTEIITLYKDKKLETISTNYRKYYVYYRLYSIHQCIQRENAYN